MQQGNNSVPKVRVVTTDSHINNNVFSIHLSCPPMSGMWSQSSEYYWESNQSG